ncbi:hypothetical protein GOP47_0018181 [Adiantum capillus-veneris]|uniref:Uncharacterized protein n=1 Tax=Adiantum capillus-veneris TaxID=13818 RepID=A0A9D4UHR9_ADICA|nr:hypothetical protein GOP47_0018181 [Adiantum capillus-veneris]
MDMASSRHFTGGPGEDISAWFQLVEKEFERLQILEDDEQANYAYQGLLGDTAYIYDLLSDEDQWSWRSMKPALFLAFYQPLEVFSTVGSGRMLLKTWRELQLQFWLSLEASTSSEYVSHTMELDQDISFSLEEPVELEVMYAESDQEMGYSGDYGESSTDGEESFSDEECEEERLCSLKAVYPDLQSVNQELEQRVGLPLVVVEEPFLPGGDGDVSVGEFESSCGECKNPGELVLQVESHVDGCVDDYVFFDNLLSEAGVVALIVAQFDGCRYNETNGKVLESLFDEGRPLGQVTGDLVVDVYADATHVFKALVCLCAGIYVFDSLLKALVVKACNGGAETGVVNSDVVISDSFQLKAGSFS